MDALFVRQYEQRKLFEHKASPLLPSGQECHVFGGNHASLLMGLPNAEVTDDFRFPPQIFRVAFSEEEIHGRQDLHSALVRTDIQTRLLGTEDEGRL